MKEVYFNNIQQDIMLVGANTTVIVAGRRTGKTDGMASPFVLRNMQRMQGSTGGIVVPSYKHGLTNTLPGLFAAWKRWGYIEGTHYVVGKRPPKQFAEPIIKPSDYSHAITFYNGSTAILVSQEVHGAANSLTLSWLLIDEARFIDFDFLKNEVFPANGGSKLNFGNKSYNHSIMVLTDMPSSTRGSWVLNYKEKQDPELIECIKATQKEIWDIKQQKQTKTTRERLQQLNKELNQMRSVAVYYREVSTIENIEILGEKYIADMRRDLTPLTFQTSILSQRIGQLKDGFYNNFNAGHILDDEHRQPNLPAMVVLSSHFVKYQKRLPALVQAFCKYYKNHRQKTVIFFYDTTAIGQNYAVNTHDFRWAIMETFKQERWRVIPAYIGKPMRHDEKYQLINSALQGKETLTPYIIGKTNEDLIIALQQAGVHRGRNGFQKNKEGEKLPESEENLLEHRTDGTDAFDTLFIGCERFRRYTVAFNNNHAAAVGLASDALLALMANAYSTIR